jgi:hypothetical protein
VEKPFTNHQKQRLEEVRVIGDWEIQTKEQNKQSKTNKEQNKQSKTSKANKQMRYQWDTSCGDSRVVKRMQTCNQQMDRSDTMDTSLLKKTVDFLVEFVTCSIRSVTTPKDSS